MGCGGSAVAPPAALASRALVHTLVALLPIQLTVKQQRVNKVLGTLLGWRLRRSCSVLASAWPSPGCCNQRVEGLGLYSTFQMTQYIGKIFKNASIEGNLSENTL